MASRTRADICAGRTGSVWCRLVAVAILALVTMVVSPLPNADEGADAAPVVEVANVAAISATMSCVAGGLHAADTCSISVSCAVCAGLDALEAAVMPDIALLWSDAVQVRAIIGAVNEPDRRPPRIADRF